MHKLSKTGETKMTTSHPKERFIILPLKYLKTLESIDISLQDISQSLRNLDLDSYRLSLRKNLYPQDKPCGS